ncbi:phage holin [Cytobacillus horneckiae]|uniref:phage holin n=1 Tax=Cytobacillus horneckiae TaxID=549687 RepID=UPI0034CFCBFC
MLAMNKGAVTRIVLFLLAWLNQFLVSKGYDSLPVLGEAEVSAIIVFVVSAWTLATNNKVKPKKKDEEE